MKRTRLLPKEDEDQLSSPMKEAREASSFSARTHDVEFQSPPFCLQVQIGFLTTELCLPARLLALPSPSEEPVAQTGTMRHHPFQFLVST